MRGASSRPPAASRACFEIEVLSERLHSRLFPDLPRMTMCSHAWWRRECLVWALYVRLVDPLWRYVGAPGLDLWRGRRVRLGEQQHCQGSYLRRWG